jgi:ankyrin repeat protein
MSFWRKLLGASKSDTPETSPPAITLLGLSKASAVPLPSMHQPIPPPKSPSGLEIHDAAEAGDLVKVKTLLKDNPNLVFSKGKEGGVPLHWAAVKGHKDVAELLLAHGAEVDAKARYGITPLYLAAHKGHKNLAALLLANHAEVNTKTDKGYTPLLIAAEEGRKEVAELLLSYGADINIVEKVDNWTPLHKATANGHKDVAELLLAHGAEINAANNNYGVTPLHVAAHKGYKDVAELLLARGAEVNAKDKDGETPLHIAAKENRSIDLNRELRADHGGVVELLLRHGGRN